jgi:hypothetical protein
MATTGLAAAAAGLALLGQRREARTASKQQPSRSPL